MSSVITGGTLLGCLGLIANVTGILNYFGVNPPPLFPAQPTALLAPSSTFALQPAISSTFTTSPSSTPAPTLTPTSTLTVTSTEAENQIQYFQKDCVPESLWTVVVTGSSPKSVDGCLLLTTYGLDAYDNGFTVALDQTDQSFGIHTPLLYRSGGIHFTIQIDELETADADEPVNLNFGFYDAQAISYFGKLIYISTSSKSPPRISF